jgi:hypothetical protein
VLEVLLSLVDQVQEELHQTQGGQPRSARPQEVADK